jgi:hypothetical protein
MKAHIPLILCSFVLLLFSFSILLPAGAGPAAGAVHAAPEAQFITATPGPDGRILYIVVEGDSCLQVALLHNITVQQLRQFNTRLDENCTLTVGQQLVVGLAQPEAPTAGPAPTLPSPTVTATPVSGTTEVCTVSAVDPDTLLLVRSCFVDVPGGEYNVSMAVPDEYNPTMLLSYTLTVKAGDLAEISFGAQSKTLTVSEPTDSQEGNRSSLLGIFGFLLLLGGAGLGYYAYRSGQPKSKLKGSPLTKR